MTENGQEIYTSPKKPDEVPAFMDIFLKAFLVEEVADEDNLDIETGGQSSDEPSMNVNVKPRESVDPYDASVNTVSGPGGAPQVIGTVPTEEDDYQEPDKPEDSTKK